MSLPDPGQVRSLVAGARNGDHQAFAEIVTIFEARLHGLVRLICRDATEAADIVQDAFVRAYENLHRFDESRGFYPWLATIATRLAHNHLRKRSRILDREGTALPADVVDECRRDPASIAIADEETAQLWAAVASLPYGERTSLFLVYKQGCSIAEAATVLGTGKGAVKTWLYRARHKLQRLVVKAAAVEEEVL